MKKWMFVLFISMLVIAGCGQSNEETESNNGEVPAAIEANLDIPETADKDEEVTLSVTVTQGEEAVEDADEVKFEIWKEGQKEDSEVINSTHDADGRYIAAKTFSEDGVYLVQSHVTARSMHTMPQKQIIVGDAEEQEHHDHGDEADAEGHDHGHSDSVAITLEAPDKLQANKAANLKATILHEEKALEGAMVRLEIVNNKDEHQVAWVDMEEENAGDYETSHTFKASGKYKVVVHVENEEGLHEHIEKELTVE
ncbi:YtkA-like protein [Cytobacillus horneckiae]|uniref:FixH family protein n=1 Tax=Cytobacillus horneckiae TaxID=549687 RepID=UPI0019D21C03|nr:FixH family protein [Cytobacillus horneckiae]MBN6889134.1 FixH family protein [Cytobacillus horneckiae]MCM3180680.1 FixH family protein [Cytobacillus horneckiae]